MLSEEFNESALSIPLNIDSKKEASDSSPSSIDEIVKAVQHMYDEMSKSLDGLDEKLDQHLGQIEQDLRQEINQKISEQTSLLRKEIEEKTKLAVHASLQLAKEHLEEMIGQTRAKISEEI